MATYAGILNKMNTHHADPVQYKLALGGDTVEMNSLLGTTLKLEYKGQINCIVCGRKSKKSFAGGLCYPCFLNAPENSECIIRPELCEGHNGIGRDPEWEKKHHVAPHYAYLALTSAVKIGVTRDGNTPFRWMNQGARQVILLAETPYRRLAGDIEVMLKEFVTDKTHWQKMLKDVQAEGVDLVAEKNRLLDLLPEELGQYYSGNDEVMTFNYPVLEYPTKVKSLNLEKTPVIELELRGIRGQYLIFNDGQVINLRKYAGYNVELTTA